MKAVGIIAEYHPFHNGHAFQINQLRNQGFDVVVCVMSTGLVQRGEWELLPYWIRAKAALLSGADLVISLPAPYANQSAQGFAFSSVSLLHDLTGVDTLAFGAESPCLKDFIAAAQCMQTQEFICKVKEEIQRGAAPAIANSRALGVFLKESQHLLQMPNNLLGVYYCEALLRLNSKIKPLSLKRQGTNHDAKEVFGQYASASYLREQMTQGLFDLEQWNAYVPQACHMLYHQAQREGLFLKKEHVDFAVLSRLRAQTKEELSLIRGGNEGLSNRLYKQIRFAQSFAHLIELTKTKRYTNSRIRRLIVDATLSYQDDFPKKPPYLHILGATQTGLNFLKQVHPSIPAHASLKTLQQQNKDCLQVAQAQSKAVDFASLCRHKVQPCGNAYTMGFQQVSVK